MAKALPQGIELVREMGAACHHGNKQLDLKANMSERVEFAVQWVCAAYSRVAMMPSLLTG